MQTGSTNADLLAAASAGASDRTVLATDHQTAGRGRLDRRWEAPPAANLLVSILFRDVPAVPGELTRRVGLAAALACGEVASVDVRLKWPNDLLLDGSKLGGILAQRSPGGEVVVGLGLNVGWAPAGAACLGVHAPTTVVDPPTVLAALLEAYDRLPDDIGGAYRDHLDTLGRRVRVELPGAAADLVGRAVAIDDDGRLVVLDDCAITHHLDVGDVVHVRPSDPVDDAAGR